MSDSKESVWNTTSYIYLGLGIYLDLGIYLGFRLICGCSASILYCKFGKKDFNRFCEEREIRGTVLCEN